MPIEVIQRGEVPEEKSATFSCHHCKPVLRAKVSDGLLTYDPFVGFTCPVCQGQLAVSLK